MPPPQLAVNQWFMCGNIVFRKGKTKCCIKMAKKSFDFGTFRGVKQRTPKVSKNRLCYAWKISDLEPENVL